MKTKNDKVALLEKRIEELENRVNWHLVSIIIVLCISITSITAIKGLEYRFDKELQNVPHKVCRNETEIWTYDLLDEGIPMEKRIDYCNRVMSTSKLDATKTICIREEVKEVCEYG